MLLLLEINYNHYLVKPLALIRLVEIVVKRNENLWNSISHTLKM
jgi:hypothetical protein